MRYHVLRNVLVRNASIVLFTKSQPAYRPEKLLVFFTKDAHNSSLLQDVVDLQFEPVPAGGGDPFSACAFPWAGLNVALPSSMCLPGNVVWGMLHCIVVLASCIWQLKT